MKKKKREKKSAMCPTRSGDGKVLLVLFRGSCGGKSALRGMLGCKSNEFFLSLYLRDIAKCSGKSREELDEASCPDTDFAWDEN